MAPPDGMKRIAIGALMALFTAGVHAADDPAVLESARAAIRVKDYRRAIVVLQPAVRGGDADAQFLLASLQRVGLGVDADVQAARQLLTAAANQQHAAAAYGLAMMLAHDEPRDPARAHAWLQIAAKAGHPLAQATLERGSLPLQFLPHKDLSEAGARRAAFWLAVQQGDAAMAAALVDGTMLGLTDDFGRGILAHAAQRGAGQVAELLMRKGANVNQADSFGITPLMLAVANADLSTVERLLQAGANPDAADRVGNSALMYACGRNPDAAVVNRLLKAVARADAVNAQGWSALDWALAADAQPIAAVLRARGLVTKRKPAIVAEAVEVPLRRAAGSAVDLYRGLPDVQVAATRSSAAMLNAVLQSTPAAAVPAAAVYSATVAESVPALQALFASESQPAGAQPSETLLWAVRHADPPVVQALLSRRSGVRDVPGEESPLIAAVRAHRSDNVQVLLDAQIPVDAVDATGMSASMIAVATAQPEALAQLMKHLARVDVVDKSGRSALWYAAAAGAADAVDMLLAARVAVNVADISGQTPLAVAAAQGHAQIVTALLKSGASASTPSVAGATPLMLAARNGNTSVMRALLAAGASIDAQNRHGDTALIAAARNARTEAVRVLLAAGASDKLRNVDRASAQDVANALGLGEIERLLARD
jgi:ankyrin repeat protein